MFEDGLYIKDLFQSNIVESLGDRLVPFPSRAGAQRNGGEGKTKKIGQNKGANAYVFGISLCII